MKKSHFRAGLSIFLVGAMAFGMAACGGGDKEEASAQPGASSPGAAFNEREGYYVETVYEMPANTYAVVSPYMRADGVVEFLGQTQTVFGDTSAAAGAEAATESGEAASPSESTEPAETPGEATANPESATGETEAPKSTDGDTVDPAAEAGGAADSAATPESVDAHTPELNLSLYEWDMENKTWEKAEAPWLEEIQTQVGNVNAMTMMDDGSRYVVASEKQDDSSYDENGYTPAKLILYIVGTDGSIRTQDVDWHVANFDYSGMDAGMESQLEVTKATFERVDYGRGLEAEETAATGIVDGQDGQEGEATEATAVVGESADAATTDGPADASPAPADAEGDDTVAASPSPEAEAEGSEEESEEEESPATMFGGMSQTAPSVNSITVLDNGNMLIGDYMATLMYDGEGNYIDYLDSGSYGGGAQMALDGNNMYMVGSSGRGQEFSASVNQYDLSATDFSEPVAVYPGPTGSRNYYYNAQLSVEGNTLYWMDQTGIFSYDMSAGDAGEWKEIAGAELLYITDPDTGLQGLQADGKGNFYTMLSSYGGGMSTNSFLAITYTTDAPIEITAEITIYSLSDDYTVRREVSKFRKKNPNVLVNIQTGMDYESSATKQDVINSLNKLLLAEKGPDMLILDGLPIDSYIEKGVMMDLSEWMAPKLSQGIWMEGLAKAYEGENGGIYALPTGMTVPIVMGKQSALDDMESLTDFADYVSAAGDLPAVYDTTPMGLMRICYMMASNSVLNEDGSFNEAGLAQFLTDVKKISDTDKGTSLSQELYDRMAEYSESGEFDYDFSYSMAGNGTLPYAFKDSSFSFDELYGTDSWKMVEAANDKRGAEDSGVSLVPANGRHIFEPRNIIGINARTQYKEECLAFLDSMTAPAGDEENGRNFYGIPLVMENMMPIERTPEEIAALGGVESFSSFGYGHEKGRQLIVEGEPKRVDAEALIAFLQPLDTPAVVDSELVKAIYDNSKGFFDGSETAEQAVSKIVDATRIYMNE